MKKLFKVLFFLFLIASHIDANSVISNTNIGKPKSITTIFKQEVILYDFVYSYTSNGCNVSMTVTAIFVVNTETHQILYWYFSKKPRVVIDCTGSGSGIQTARDASGTVDEYGRVDDVYFDFEDTNINTIVNGSGFKSGLIDYLNNLIDTYFN